MAQSIAYVYTNFGIHTMLSNKDKNILTEVPKMGSYAVKHYTSTQGQGQVPVSTTSRK